ncbi:fibroblast growth factor 1-like [Meleagris gallopavo]|uniref:fibroblast growth factor 1-like n=1 Tax=Meleagris gallopavo TaxID=9103 RepID=UPI00093BE454|nr:fibroblast growth factor 1-like [Meleagris gallopavo]
MPNIPVLWMQQKHLGHYLSPLSLFPFPYFPFYVTVVVLFLLPVQLQLSAEDVGEVYIKSTASGQYLAMDPNGLLYGSLPGEECLFLERLEENHYNTYISKKHADKNWFVGLKKNGNSKLGPRTHYGQKAILFLPLPVSAD